MGKTTTETFKFFIFSILMVLGTLLSGASSIMTVFVVSCALLLLLYMKHEQLKTEKFDASIIYCLVIILTVFHMIDPFGPYDQIQDEWADTAASGFFVDGFRGFFNYMKVNGSALPYVPRAILSLYIFITGGIENIRIIPHILFLLSCFAFYFAGKEIQDKELGLSMMLVYTLSSLSLYTSRHMMANSYFPLLIPLCLGFLFKLSRTGLYSDLFLFLGIFTAGFFTYAGWFFVIPALIVGAVIQRKILNQKMFAVLIFAMIFITAGSLYLYMNSPHSISRITSSEGFNSAAGLIRRILTAVKLLPVILTKPMGTPYAFSTTVPVLSFAEIFLFIGGLILAVKRIRDKKGIIILTGLIFSFTSLIPDGAQHHHLRHIVMYVYIIIITSFFVKFLIKTKYFYPVIFTALFSFFFVFIEMHLFWEAKNNIDKSIVKINSYIKERGGGEPAFVLHEALPYGLNGVAFYNIRGRSDIPRANSKGWIVSDYFNKDLISRSFNVIAIKIIYSDIAGKLPYFIYEIKIETEEEARLLLELKNTLREINVLMWEYRYYDAVSLVWKSELKNPDSQKKIFFNNCLRMQAIESCYALNDPKCAYFSFFNNENRIQKNAIFYYYQGKIALMYGYKDQANEAFLKAERLAPWWKAVKKHTE